MSADTLLSSLHALPVLDSQGRRLLRSLPPGLPGQEGVRELVREGALTQMQADWLLAGKAEQLVLGPFTLLDKLGEGGMGVVYKARHRELGRIQAVKLLADRASRDEMAQERFQREAQAAAALHHPNIVTIHDAGRDGGRFYLAFEFVPGQDLQRLVEARGPLPAREACEYVVQAAEGMQHAHERGLVHRDLKPSNLLLTPEGVVKVADLGLAGWRAELAGTVDSNTPEGAILGTPDFMAPEQARDPRKSDIRADVYSLGCTLYYLLAGRPPFPEGTLTLKLLLHQEEMPGPPPGLPEGLWAVLARALAKRPENRPATPGEFAALLDPFVMGRPPAPPPATLAPAGQNSSTVDIRKPGAREETLAPTSSTQATLGPPARSWWWAVGLLALLPLALLSGWWLLRQGDKEPTPPPGPEKNGAIAPKPQEKRQTWHPDDLVAVLGDARWRHWGPALAVAASANGKLVVSRGLDAHVRIWDAATGKPVAALPLKAHAGEGVAIDGSGEVVAAGGNNGDVWVWQGPDWHLSRQARHEENVLAVAFQPGSRVLATGDGGGLVRWGLVGEKPLMHRCVGNGAVRSLAWQEGGAVLAAGDSDGGIHLIGIKPKAEARVIYTGRGEAFSLAFLPEGRLASAHKNGSVCLWNVESGKLHSVCGEHKGSFARAVAVSPDGKWLASAGWDDRCFLYKAKPGEKTGELSFRRHRPNALAWLPGREPALLVANEQGIISRWSPLTRKRLGQQERHSGPVEAMCWLPSGELASIAGDDQVRAWALSTGKHRSFPSGLDGPGYALAMCDGLLAAGGMSDAATVCLLDPATGKQRGALRFWGQAYSLAPLPEGRLLVGGNAKRSEIWSIRTQERTERLPEFGEECWSVAAEGGRFALGDGGYGGEAFVRLFGPGLKPAGTYGKHHQAVNAMAFHSGRLASGDMAGQVFLDGEKVGKPLSGFISDLAWSPDGRHLAVANSTGVVQWRKADGARVKSWQLPGAVKSLALTPDGKHLLTGNADGTIFVLRLP